MITYRRSKSWADCMELKVLPARQATSLKLSILIEKKADGGVITSVLEIPTYRVEAETREQALANLQKLIAEHLEGAEVIPLEVNLSQNNGSTTSWVKFAGIFKDDPDFAEIAEEIRAERQADDDTEINPSLYSVSS